MTVVGGIVVGLIIVVCDGALSVVFGAGGSTQHFIDDDGQTTSSNTS